jgi:hypothetical protein
MNATPVGLNSWVLPFLPFHHACRIMLGFTASSGTTFWPKMSTKGLCKQVITTTAPQDGTRPGLPAPMCSALSPRYVLGTISPSYAVLCARHYLPVMC